MGIKGRKKGVYELLPSIIDRCSLPIPECGCYVWLGGTSGKDEYGRVRYTDSNGIRRTRSSHRAVYEVFKGSIPIGMEIDHICNMPWCVNPDHLRAVLPLENTRKAIKEFCDKGHLRTEITNTDSKRKHRFECPECRSEYLRLYNLRNAERIRAREADRRISNRVAYNARKLAESKRRKAERSTT